MAKYVAITICTIFICLTVDIVTRNVLTTYLKVTATCPGPLEAGDYHTPEEDAQ